jgi:multidrug efflux pump subunit AcrA (membrane-fusion protein)
MISKRTFAAATLWIALAIVLSACSDNPAGRKASPTPVPTLVKYEPAMFTVEQGSLVSQTSITGEIVPAAQEILNFRAAGTVNRVTVKNGDRVKKGDLLAELQVDDLLNQLQQAQIDLEVAQSALEKAKTDRLYAADKAQIDLNIAQARLDLAKLEFDNSMYGVARSRAALNLTIAEQNYNTSTLNLKIIGDTTILKEEQVVQRQKLAVQRLESLLAERQISAPSDGIVLRVTVQAGKQINAFYPAIEIGDPAVLVIRATPDSKIESQIDSSSEVQMSFSASSKEIHPVKYLPNFLPFNALEIDKQQAFIQSWIYFSAPADLPQDQLKVGSTVSLNIVIGRRENVLLLPPAAIRNYRGLNFVIVQDGDRRRRVEITKIGLQTNDRWEIEGDLQPGNRIFGQ